MAQDYPDIEPVPDPPAHDHRLETDEDPRTANLSVEPIAGGEDR